MVLKVLGLKVFSKHFELEGWVRAPAQVKCIFIQCVVPRLPWLSFPSIEPPDTHSFVSSRKYRMESMKLLADWLNERSPVSVSPTVRQLCTEGPRIGSCFVIESTSPGSQKELNVLALSDWTWLHNFLPLFAEEWDSACVEVHPP